MQNARMQYLVTGFIGDIYTLKIGRHESVLGMSLSQFFQDIYNLCYTQDITFGTCIVELISLGTRCPCTLKQSLLSKITYINTLSDLLSK